MEAVLNSERKSSENLENPDIKGDKLNILLLTFLYFLQGLPMGIVNAIPFILEKRNVTKAEQAEFSFVTYAFSCKAMWAPVVDCIYSKRIGRRKTWFIPAQYIMGFFFLLTSMYMDDWMGGDSGVPKPNVRLLTIVFFVCFFFIATQDVAVDGWGLTMLKRRNVGYVSTCNLVGNMIGLFIGHVPFTILGSKDFFNQFRSVPLNTEIVSFAEFLFFWAIIYFISTTLILILKRDDSLDGIDYSENSMELKMNIKEAYLYTWQILKLKPILLICALILTCRIIYSPVDAVAPLKLMTFISQDAFALIRIPLLPMQIILPAVFSRYFTGSKCLQAFLSMTMYKVNFGIFFIIIIYCTKYVTEKDELPSWYCSLVLLIYLVRELLGFLLQTSLLAFFCRVSDPHFGGIYLTLLNTFNNIGYVWPQTLALWLVDKLTITTCSDQSCNEILNGLYTEFFLALIIGGIFYYWSKRIVHKLENLNSSEWLVKQKRSIIKDNLLMTKVATNNY